MILPSNSLWDFSLALYASTDVERVCLGLQEEFEAKVNILLWCSWLEARGIRLTPLRLEQAHQHLARWDESVVQSLRQLRRAIKQEYGVADRSVEACRQAVKAAELAAEKVELDWLEALAGDWPVDAVPLQRGENTKHYLNSITVPEHVIALALATLSQAPDPQ